MGRCTESASAGLAQLVATVAKALPAALGTIPTDTVRRTGSQPIPGGTAPAGGRCRQAAGGCGQGVDLLLSRSEFVPLCFLCRSDFEGRRSRPAACRPHADLFGQSVARRSVLEGNDRLRPATAPARYCALARGAALQAAFLVACASRVACCSACQVSVHAQPAQESPTPKPSSNVRFPGTSRPQLRRSRINIGNVDETVLP